MIKPQQTMMNVNQILTWTCSLEHHIAGDFGGDIEGKKDRESDVIVQSFHSKFLLEVDETGIADVGTVEVA
jgi:hypothetical protein